MSEGSISLQVCCSSGVSQQIGVLNINLNLSKAEIWAVKANPVKAGSPLLYVTSHSERHECKQMNYRNHLIMLCCVLLQLFNTYAQKLSCAVHRCKVNIKLRSEVYRALAITDMPFISYLAD